MDHDNDKTDSKAVLSVSMQQHQNGANMKENAMNDRVEADNVDEYEAFYTPPSSPANTPTRGDEAFVSISSAERVDSEANLDADNNMNSLSAKQRKYEEKIMLDFASRNDFAIVMEMVVERGVHVDAVNSQGDTLFVIACQNGNKRLAKLALRYGADIDHQNV